MNKIIKKMTEFLINLNLIMRFEDDELENQFLDKTYNQHYSYNKIIYISGFMLISMFFILIYYFYNNEESNKYIIYTLIINTIYSFFTIILIHIDSNRIKRILSFIYLISITIGITCLMVVIVNHKTVNGHIIHCGLLLLVISGFAFIRVQFKYALIFMISTSLIYEIYFIPGVNFSLPELIFNQFLFFCTLLIGITVSYNMEKKERHDFLKLLIIVEDRLKLADLNGTLKS